MTPNEVIDIMQALVRRHSPKFRLGERIARNLGWDLAVCEPDWPA